MVLIDGIAGHDKRRLEAEFDSVGFRLLSRRIRLWLISGRDSRLLTRLYMDLKLLLKVWHRVAMVMEPSDVSNMSSCFCRMAFHVLGYATLNDL
jgi:hypothetical protein